MIFKWIKNKYQAQIYFQLLQFLCFVIVFARNHDNHNSKQFVLNFTKYNLAIWKHTIAKGIFDFRPNLPQNFKDWISLILFITIVYRQRLFFEINDDNVSIED